MKIAVADPPYPGQAARRYGDQPDYAGEVDLTTLLKQLMERYDGWALHTSSVALPVALGAAASAGAPFRLMAWVKPFAAFKRNVSVAYAWEPILVHAARKPIVSHRVVMRDWFSESITLKRGLTGAKPERLCHWLFEVMGCHPDDEFHDLYPGTGAIGRAWETWRLTVPPVVEETA